MTEPLVPNIPEAVRQHGRALVAVLALASIAVGVSGSVWPESAKQLVPLRVAVASVLMVPAGLLALVLMPPDRATRYRATPRLFRAWVVMWIAEIALGAVVLVLYVSPEARRFALSLPEWVLSCVGYLVLFAAVTWFGFAWVLVAEAWHWARGWLHRRVVPFSRHS